MLFYREKLPLIPKKRPLTLEENDEIKQKKKDLERPGTSNNF
jgi:hypothetical protein